MSKEEHDSSEKVDTGVQSSANDSSRPGTVKYIRTITLKKSPRASPQRVPLNRNCRGIFTPQKTSIFASTICKCFNNKPDHSQPCNSPKCFNKLVRSKFRAPCNFLNNARKSLTRHRKYSSLYSHQESVVLQNRKNATGSLITPMNFSYLRNRYYQEPTDRLLICDTKLRVISKSIH